GLMNSRLPVDGVTMATDIARALAENYKPEWTLRVVQPDPAPASDRSLLVDMNEEQLVAACVAGHREAFEIIVERHRRTVYQLCYRFVGNHEDASDLSQDVFLRAYRGLNRFRGQSALATWLYRIGVNVCLNRVSLKTTLCELIEKDLHVVVRFVS